MTPEKLQLPPGIKEDATAKNQVALRSIVNAIRFLLGSPCIILMLSTKSDSYIYIVWLPFSFLKREVSGAPLTADAKVVKTPLVERMVRVLPSLLCYISCLNLLFFLASFVHFWFM